MTGFDHDALAAAMPWMTRSFRILDLSDDTRGAIPERWRPIAGSPDPEERKRAAMASWNDDFLALVPRFAHALEHDLLDVRVAVHSWLGGPLLYYVVAGAAEYGVWTGADPTVPWDRDPPFFDSLPAAAQVFLRDVHAGFTTWDGESCGLTPPSDMKSFADYCGDPDDASTLLWEETSCPPPRMNRLLRVTGRGPYADLLISPDLPQGSAVTFYGAGFELEQFAEALDRFMMVPICT